VSLWGNVLKLFLYEHTKAVDSKHDWNGMFLYICVYVFVLIVNPRWVPPQDIVLTWDHIDRKMKKKHISDTRNRLNQTPCKKYLEKKITKINDT